MSDPDYLTRATKGIWRRFLLLIPLVLVIVFICRAYLGGVVDTYTARGFYPHGTQTITDPEVVLSELGVVEVVSVQQNGDDFIDVTFRALKDGSTEVTLYFNDPLETQIFWEITVRDGAVLEGGINFSGWECIHIGTCVVLAAVVILFASALIELWRIAWYGYEMVACGGGLFFSVFQFGFFTMLLIRGHMPSYSIFVIHITYMAQWFTVLSAPFVGLLLLLVSVSNISLIRNEGFRPINLLGIMSGVAWLAIHMLWAVMGDLLFGLPPVLISHVDSIIAVAITFGECLLLSTMLCAWLASRHVPKHGADYVVVLGCGVRADGTPCPLLAGRVDGAVDYDKTRVAIGDAPATFVPSGGQGPDEPISEAQSMATYLKNHHDVDFSRIVIEDRSTTTRENMAFSREVIERHAGRDVCKLSVVFSTTNYHVFRGYVCAHEAGMVVEGIGSKTKYYFWPNAFLREFVGLLAAQWRGLLQTYAIIALIYIFAEYSLTLT